MHFGIFFGKILPRKCKKKIGAKQTGPNPEKSKSRKSALASRKPGTLQKLKDEFGFMLLRKQETEKRWSVPGGLACMGLLLRLLYERVQLLDALAVLPDGPDPGGRDVLAATDVDRADRDRTGVVDALLTVATGGAAPNPRWQFAR